MIDRVADGCTEVGFFFRIGVNPLATLLFYLNRRQEGAGFLFQASNTGNRAYAVGAHIDIASQAKMEGIDKDKREVDMTRWFHFSPFAISTGVPIFIFDEKILMNFNLPKNIVKRPVRLHPEQFLVCYLWLMSHPNGPVMAIDRASLQKTKTAILSDAMSFLKGLRSGETEELLLQILDRIKANESAMLRAQGEMVDPRLWRYLNGRLNRRNEEWIDPGQLRDFLDRDR